VVLFVSLVTKKCVHLQKSVMLEFQEPDLTWTAVEPERADTSKLWTRVRCFLRPIYNAEVHITGVAV